MVPTVVGDSIKMDASDSPTDLNGNKIHRYLKLLPDSSVTASLLVSDTVTGTFDLDEPAVLPVRRVNK